MQIYKYNVLYTRLYCIIFVTNTIQLDLLSWLLIHCFSVLCSKLFALRLKPSALCQAFATTFIPSNRDYGGQRRLRPSSDEDGLQSLCSLLPAPCPEPCGKIVRLLPPGHPGLAITTDKKKRSFDRTTYFAGVPIVCPSIITWFFLSPISGASFSFGTIPRTTHASPDEAQHRYTFCAMKPVFA
jgi:hypothetical protein